MLRSAGTTLLVGLGVAITAASLAAAAPTAPATAAVPRTFITRPLDLGASSYRMYDLGVVDYNGDGNPDIFSTNHTTRMALRPGDGTLNYPTDVVSQLGLDSDPQLPGVEEIGTPADLSAPGLYLYRTAPGKLVVNAVLGAGVSSVAASLTFYGGVHSKNTGGAQTVITAGTDSQGRPTNTVAFTASTSGTATLTLELDGVALDANVTSPADPSLIKLGAVEDEPPAPQFSWFLHDRHGVAWTDVNGDGLLDMTTANGGLKDQLSTFPGLTADEMLLAGPSGFTNQTPQSLIDGHCRSRAMHWVDVNGDGLLDLFITCEQQPSRLLISNGDGTFTDESNDLPKIADAVPFLWIDLNGDRIPELIVPTPTGLGLYTRSGTGAYLRQKKLAPAGTFTDLALADINDDGYPDVYAASPTASRLLIGTSTGFTAVSPTRYGLPATAQRASWVDVDNDGRVDLFTAPGGVYLQRKTGHFAASGLLTDIFPAGAGNQLFDWFDADNDGDRDLVSEYQPDPSSYSGVVNLTENQYARGHWLELDLVGPAGNSTAIGASVQVTAGGRTSTHWVGESETSTSSQGHYRIYVGLGTATTTDSIQVTWPDGTTQTVPNAGNRVVTVQYGQ